jgi:hypothetical protein
MLSGMFAKILCLQLFFLLMFLFLPLVLIQCDGLILPDKTFGVLESQCPQLMNMRVHIMGKINHVPT